MCLFRNVVHLNGKAGLSAHSLCATPDSTDEPDAPRHLRNLCICLRTAMKICRAEQRESTQSTRE